MKLAVPNMRKMRQLGCLFAVALFLVGCHTLTAPEGRELAEESRLELQGTERRGDTWSTRDVRVDYNLVLNGNVLNLRGWFQFEPPIRYNFASIAHFHLAVIFADDTGRILSMQGLAGAAGSQLDYPHAFEKTFVLPGGAAYFAFSYRGRALEGGARERGGWWDFFYYPVR